MINLSKKLIGNNNLIKRLLDNYLNQNLSNSLIFSGNKGIGKTTAAFFFINKILNKINPNNTNNSLIYNNSHPNIKYITKLIDEKNNKLKNNISIDQIRLLGHFLNQSTFDSLPKFVIIDAADDLTHNAANSLLKSLEEPKKNTYFILISHQISNLLPTIRSRCFNYVFDSPTYGEFSDILIHNNNLLSSVDINFLFNIFNGSCGLALKFNNENIKEIFNHILQIFIDKKGVSININNMSNEVVKYSNEEFKNFIILLRFIILSFIKINLGYSFDSNISSDLLKLLNNVAISTPNSISLEILEFLNENEKDMFIYNLDKKFFFLNIFSSLNKI